VEKAMATIELRLDEQTIERIERIAARRSSTVETLVKEIIDLLATVEVSADPMMGMFADDPDLMDQITASAMKARENDPLRLDHGQSPGRH
jgi:hypothetical protein